MMSGSDKFSMMAAFKFLFRPRGSSGSAYRPVGQTAGARPLKEGAEKALGTADRVAGPRGCHPVRVSRVRGVGGRAGRRPRGTRETGGMRRTQQSAGAEARARARAGRA